MPRPTRLQTNHHALLHNVACIKRMAPKQQIVAMVKANAYGCGIEHIVPTLEGQVDAFGVVLLEEAQAIRRLGARTPCVVFQGAFEAQDWQVIANEGFSAVIHQARQLEWLLDIPLNRPVRVWVKVDTGMHRLGFLPDDVARVLKALDRCPWVIKPLTCMTHFASADLNLPSVDAQWRCFEKLPLQMQLKSAANSAAIFNLPHTHADIVRPGICLYGVSPFSEKTGLDLGLQAVNIFSSQIIAIHHLQPGESVGYGGTWTAQRPSKIGVVAAGYGDGYPRHIQPNTAVAIRGQTANIVGRVSMDSLTIDLTELSEVKIGEPVELWGKQLPIEWVARSAGTIAYELLCKIKRR